MKKLLTLILFTAIAFTVFAQNEVRRVAILETVDKFDAVPYLKKLMFRSNLTTAITNTQGYEGYDRADLKQIIGEQNFQRTGLVSDAQIKKIGEFTGAQYVLIAEATIDGEDMFITAKIIDVETAHVIRNSNQLMGISAEEMQKGSKKVAEELLGCSPSSSSSSSSSRVSQGFVDLGLPSGTLWKDKNEDGGFYTYDQAVSRFGSKLPTKEQLEELKNGCTWTWQGNGYNVVGPNGNSIFLPAAGCRGCSGSVSTVGSTGNYWSSTPYGSEDAWILRFRPNGASVYENLRCLGLSVRLVQ